MIVDVYFTTQLRTALARTQEQVSLREGATLDDLVRQLAESEPHVFERFVVDDQGNFLPNIIFCVGDRQVTDAKSHVLHDGASVTILSAISGG